MGVRRFEDLLCWQLSRQLKIEVFALTNMSPANNDRDFCHDIRRSGRRAPANIAEGFGRETHREFAHFVCIAKASLHETANHIHDALDSRYLVKDEHDRLLALAERALAATAGLHAHLVRTPNHRRHGRP
jgi:four helix bundle protein